MAEQSNNTEWSTLALLRFFLAFVVFSGHLRAFTEPATDWVVAFDAFGGKAAVVGFLLVSGYSIAASLERSEDGFYRRRFLRIYPLYIGAVLLAAALQIVAGDDEGPALPAIVNGGYGWPTVIGNVFMLQTFVVKPIAFDGPLWSLAIEVFYYLLAPLLFRLRSIWLIALVSGSMLCYVLPRHGDWDALYVVLTKLNALRFLWCWLLGFLIRRRPGAAVALLTVLGALLVGNAWDMPEPLSLATFMVSALLLATARRQRLPATLRTVADYLGDLSYPLYLFHFPGLLLAFLFLGWRSTAALLACCIAVSLFGFYLIDRWLKPRYIAPWVLRRRQPLSGAAEPSPAND